ncbi:MAG: hypothetical protein JWQ48_2706, partial [Conexibacter sp.]|nr:hypothetical protein [Conexibacter sp.]
MTVRRLDAEGLELGGGLEVLLQATLAGMPAGACADVVVRSRAVALELPGWARVEGHEVLDAQLDGRGPFVVRVRRGAGARVLADALPP